MALHHTFKQKTSLAWRRLPACSRDLNHTKPADYRDPCILCGIDHSHGWDFHFEVENNSLQTVSPRRYLSLRQANEVPSVNNGAVKVSEAGSTEATQLTENALAFISALYQSRNITPNEVQEQMLASHVRAMVHRSLTGEPLPEVEESLFDEISPDSLAMAQEVVDLFGNLPTEEAWLLSVHFEVAKDNL